VRLSFGALKIMVDLRDMQDSVLYFNKFDMFAVMDAARQEADKTVQAINADVLLNTPIDDLVSQIVEKHRLDVPVLLRAQAHLEEPRESTVTRDDYGRQIRQTVTVLTLRVPFTGDGGMFWVRPNTFDSAPPRANLDHNELVLRISGAGMKGEDVTKRFNTVMDDFDRYLGWQRGSAEELATDLESRVKRAAVARRDRLLADRNLAAALPFPIRARASAKQTFAAPEVRRIIRSQPPTVPAGTFKPEPILTEDDYQHVLSVVQGMTLTIERNASTFAKLDEEQLRDMYLVPLNGSFEGAATGETFNAAGKTDILIRAGDRNIFIAECKVWHGPKQLTEAIDQLFGYLTWRDTKAAIIIFNRNKDFSAVLASIQATVNAHPNKKHGPKIEGETRFRYVFGHPNDNNREIIVNAGVKMHRLAGEKMHQ
jgi:hypothetical protein